MKGQRRFAPRSDWDAPSGTGWGSVDAYWSRYHRWFVSMDVAPVALGRYRHKRKARHLSGSLDSRFLESLEWLSWLLLGAMTFLFIYSAIQTIRWL